MATVLLTLGRLPKALDLARGFAANGHRVLVAEPFRRHLTGASRAVAKSFRVPAPADDHSGYLAALRGIIAAEAVDLVVPISEETMHFGHLAGTVPPSVRLLTMPPADLLAMHDKARFIEIARGHGVSVPDTALLGTPAGAALATSADHVVKPVFSCSGRGVRFRQAGEALPDAAAEPPAIVQQRLQGRVLSSYSFAHRGRVLATVVYTAVLLSGTVAVVFERLDHPAAEAWIAKLVAGLNWSGSVAFDMIEDGNGAVHGIECNPRATSGLHFLEATDLAAAMLDPDNTPSIRLRPEARLQQAYSTLTEAQGAFGDWPRFRRNLALLASTRDVTWDRRDPWPFLSMTWTSWEIIAAARRLRAPFGEVATLDVGWSGPSAGSAAPSAAA